MADNKFDPNVYALSLALQLDTADAYKDLTDFGTQLETTEQKIADAAQKALASIDKVTSQIGTHLKMIADLSSKMADATGVVDTKLIKVETTTDTLADSHEEQLDRLKKQIELQEEILKAATDHEKAMQRELELHSDLTGQVRKIASEIDRKNLAHQDELDYVESENRAVQDLADNMHDVYENTRHVLDPLEEMRQIVFGTISLMREIEEGAERFVTVNYRAYGGQRELLQQTRELTTEYGLLRGQAIEAMAVLGNMRIPRDELHKTSVMVSQFSRVTGVSIAQTGEWIKVLRAGGLSFPTIEKHLTETTELMRKLGLSTGDLNRILGQTSAEAATSFEMLFPGQDAIKQITEIKMQLEGLGKYAGGPGAAALTSFIDTLSDPIAFQRFASSAEVSGQSVQDIMQGIANVGTRMLKIEQDMTATGAEAADAAAFAQKEGEALLLGNRDAALAAYRLAKAASAQGVAFDDATARSQLLATTLGNLRSSYEETLDNFYARLDQFGASWDSLRGAVLTFIADALLPLIPIATSVIGAIADFVNWIHSGIAAMDSWGGAWSGLATVLKVVTGGLLLLLTIGVPLHFTFSLLGTAVTYLGSVFGTAIGAIGAGLQALGNAVRSVMVPLLALGAALLMAGAGALMFMHGVTMVAELGWVAIPAILGMTLAIGLLGLVLVGLAYLAMPVIPALLAIGAAVLMIGAAAWLMGAGMAMAAAAFEETHDAIGPHSPAMWVALPMIATGLLAVSGATIVAVPALLALGVAMWAVAIPGLILVPLVVALTAALSGITAGNIQEAATSLYDASVSFVMAGANLLVAGVQISLGGITLAAGLTVMTAAMLFVAPLAFAMVAAAGALWLAGVVFAPAATRLLGIGAQLEEAGQGMQQGGQGLLLGSIAMMMANGLLNGVGLGLYVAAGFLSYGLGLLVPVASMAVLVGLAFQFGGGALLGGLVNFEKAAESIRRTAETIGPAALEIDKSAMALANASATLGDSGDKLVQAAPKINAAGVVMVPAAGNLKLGLDAIRTAVIGIDQAATDIQKLRTELVDLAAVAPQFVTIGADLMAGATKFHSAAASITQALQALSGSVNGFQLQGTQFEDQLELLTGLLDHYADVLERTATRIDAAIFAKAIPAILAAEQAGLEEAIRAETINTVQVLVQHEDEEAEAEQVELLKEQNEILRGLQQLLQDSLKDSKVADIAEMLASFLPDLADQRQSGMDGRFSNWIS